MRYWGLYGVYQGSNGVLIGFYWGLNKGFFLGFHKGFCEATSIRLFQEHQRASAPSGRLASSTWIDRRSPLVPLSLKRGTYWNLKI